MKLKGLWVLASASLLCVLAVAALRAYYSGYYFATPTQVYSTRDEAARRGALASGWLPDFLPRSATNIRLKLNYESNKIIAAFSFDPSEQIQAPPGRWEELSAANLADVHPVPIGKREAWFAKAIFQGKFADLTPPGFRLYRVGQRKRDGQTEVMHNWYLAINQPAGMGYLWFLVEPAS